ncbi:hypothetical protein RPB_2149 [Rhodopseudomonas palustris HaA2]|uniref:Uncharacterized protein n=1 Tax=Rhodopseudomonas palustris (strain HaA2) TaxID=316058 RepID=Q2IY55_RHOP2|nr:hypothetical protein [Rhodopseudomonas palustris]ABD06855.1 hypothetical protein RPB_2149 [Rhodopseudomonas palustris HaA2]
MAHSDDSGSSRADLAKQVDAEEEMRVLTALIGCIMVAEDAGGRDDGRTSLRHLTPPMASRGLGSPVKRARAAS